MSLREYVDAMLCEDRELECWQPSPRTKEIPDEFYFQVYEIAKKFGVRIFRIVASLSAPDE